MFDKNALNSQKKKYLYNSVIMTVDISLFFVG